MKVEKRIVTELDSPYAIRVYDCDQGKKVICASQSHDGSVCFMAKDGSNLEPVWKGIGGTMTIWPRPGKEEFFATLGFYKGFRAEESHIVYAKRDEQHGFSYRTCFTKPYLHRFTIVEVSDEKWIVGATLCDSKEYKDDWSKPGSVYVGKLPETLGEPFETSLFQTGITKNHGMYNGRHDQLKQVVIVTGVEGAFELVPPLQKGQTWTTTKLIDSETSEIYVYDIDGDGIDELVTIEGFHGDRLRIYHRTQDGYETIYSYPTAHGHALWCGRIFDRRCVLLGYRGANGGLLALFYRPSGERISMEPFLVDELEMPSNIDIWNDEDSFRIYAACDTGKVVMYTLTRDAPG